MLAKTGDELLPTEIPPNVYDGLAANRAVEVHVFGRRGPAQAKFTPLELKELDHSPTIEVIVHRTDRFEVVRKRGDAGDVAEALDPRET